MKTSVALILTVIVVFTLGISWAYAAMDHQRSHKTQHSQNMNIQEGMQSHVIEADGYKLNFHIMNAMAFRTYMDNMGHKSHKMREGMSHYIMVDISDKDYKKIKRAKVKLKIITPGNKESEKVAFPMMGSFGAEFDMSEKGKYQILTLFKIKGEKHKDGFMHEMK